MRIVGGVIFVTVAIKISTQCDNLTKLGRALVDRASLRTSGAIVEKSLEAALIGSEFIGGGNRIAAAVDGRAGWQQGKRLRGSTIIA